VVERYIADSVGPKALLRDMAKTVQVLARFGPRLPALAEKALVGLSAAAIVAMSLVALFQPDLKRMLAYSSVAQIGYVTLGSNDIARAAAHRDHAEHEQLGLVGAVVLVFVATKLLQLLHRLDDEEEDGCRDREERDQGVDEVYCVSVNDSFTMYQWGKHLGIKHVKMLPDGNGDFTRAMGKLVKKENVGFGSRSWRYSMVVDDKKIIKLPTMGGSVPISPFVTKLGVTAVIIPTVNADNNQHSANENLRLGNYFEGIKTMMGLLSSDF
jgi:hypothetical protein